MKIILQTGVLGLLVATSLPTSTVPARLQGAWRITRVLPTNNVSCWGDEEARKLVGSSLTYRSRSMRWKGGEVALQGVVVREVTAEEFREENSGSGGAAEFSQLGIRAAALTEVDLQHEDADITGATTEVPGDSVLLAGPDRIVVSACRVFFEARRVQPVR
jgi:hypothetical protein